jgi:hypothetical protein
MSVLQVAGTLNLQGYTPLSLRQSKMPFIWPPQPQGYGHAKPILALQPCWPLNLTSTVHKGATSRVLIFS